MDRNCDECGGPIARGAVYLSQPVQASFIISQCECGDYRCTDKEYGRTLMRLAFHLPGQCLPIPPTPEGGWWDDSDLFA